MTITGSAVDLRRRTGDGDDAEAPVGNAELFFDLVFVFAVTQLSHSLLAHQTFGGTLHVGLLFLAVWWVWIDTVWVANWLDVERTQVRLMLFALMIAGLFLSMSIPQAFGARGAVFAVAYVAIQVGRSLFMIWAVRRHDGQATMNFVRIMTWAIASGVFWIAGGLSDPQPRLYLWLVALALDTSGPIAFFRVPGLGRSTIGDWNIAGSHIAERCGLFIIIALGESLLITGATLASTHWKVEALAGFAAAILGAITMWWLYFNIGAGRASKSISESDDPGREGRLVYTYLHIPIVAAIIISAASDEVVLAHPTGQVLPAAALTLAGAGLFLAGLIAFKRTMAPHLPLSHLVGLALLGGLALVSGALEPYEMALAVTGVLIVVAAWETVSLRGVARELQHHRRGGVGGSSNGS